MYRLRKSQLASVQSSAYYYTDKEVHSTPNIFRRMRAETDMPKQRPLRLTDFRVESELGGGAQFLLYRATHLATARAVVLKTISKDVLKRASPKEVSRVQAEFEIHMNLSSPDVIPVLGSFHDSHNAYLVLEAAPDGDLEAALSRQPGRRIDERRAAVIVAACARALRYCHSHGVAHRDVKPGNLLLGPGERVRLADFGLSKQFKLSTLGEDGENGTLRRMKSRVGTPDYVAPETLYPRKAGYDFSADMWSLGAMLYELLVGQPPFYCDELRDTYDRIWRADYTIPSDIDISEDARMLIHGLLKFDPSRRLTPAAVLTSRWIMKHLGPSAAMGKTSRIPRPSTRRRMNSYIRSATTRR